MSHEDSSEDDFDIDDSVIETDTMPAPPRIAVPPTTETLPDGQRMEQRRFTGGDTSDEPVITTIMRDSRSFWHSSSQTVGWNQKEVAARREWDSWGPLIFCLVISLVLGLKAASSKKSQTFSVVFSSIWLGQAMITSNIKSLGGSISYLHASSITGYSSFPLSLAASFSHITNSKLVRIPVAALFVAWAIWSARRGLGFAGVSSKRIASAAYPLGLFYTCLGWSCVSA